jgi:hypothetical protein
MPTLTTCNSGQAGHSQGEGREGVWETHFRGKGRGVAYVGRVRSELQQ